MLFFTRTVNQPSRGRLVTIYGIFVPPMSQENKNISDSQSFNFGFNRLSSMAEIIEAGKRYPYSLPVQAYLAKLLKQSNDFDYERFVKVSAVLSPDRQWLYHYIQSPAALTAPVQTVKAVEVQPVELNLAQEPETVEVKPLEAEVKETIVPLVPVEPPLNIDLEEVELPGHQLPLTDDGTTIIEQALEQVEVEEVTEVVEEVPIQEKPQPVEPLVIHQEPVVIKEPVKPPVRVDILEREILKEAIDKSIQKEVSEIQPDFLSSKQDPAAEENKVADSGFQFWLNPTKKNLESREEKLRKIDALIEKFIKSEPRISPKKSDFFSPVTAAKQSVVVNDDLVSEPLALIFEKQGYFDKAIKAYEKLSLKIPEKRAYFAARIEKIKEIIKNIKNNKE